MTIRTRMRLSSITDHGGNRKTLHFGALNDTVNPGNQKFQSSTAPDGTAEFNVDTPEALAMFTQGEDYYADFFAASDLENHPLAPIPKAKDKKVPDPVITAVTPVTPAITSPPAGSNGPVSWPLNPSVGSPVPPKAPMTDVTAEPLAPYPPQHLDSRPSASWPVVPPPNAMGPQPT